MFAAKRYVPKVYQETSQTKFGFDPREIIENHALHAPKDSPFMQSTLDNDIHPIFAYPRFVNCSIDVYNVLLPALRLATLFLTDASASTYFITLAYGDRQFCSVSTRLVNRGVKRIKDDVPWSPELDSFLKNGLVEMANRVTIGFDFSDPLEKRYGSTKSNLHIVNPWNLADKCVTSRISLHRDIYSTAERLSRLRNHSDPNMALRFYFFTAVVLTHEVAHCLEAAISFSLPHVETAMNYNMWEEAGYAWETKMFGGCISPISARVDCAHGLAVHDYDGSWTNVLEQPITYHSISMEWIRMMQQREWWNGRSWASDWRYCHFPRTGARSVGSLTLNMT